MNQTSDASCILTGSILDYVLGIKKVTVAASGKDVEIVPTGITERTTLVAGKGGSGKSLLAAHIAKSIGKSEKVKSAFCLSSEDYHPEIFGTDVFRMDSGEINLEKLELMAETVSPSVIFVDELNSARVRTDIDVDVNVTRMAILRAKSEFMKANDSVYKVIAATMNSDIEGQSSQTSATGLKSAMYCTGDLLGTKMERCHDGYILTVSKLRSKKGMTGVTCRAFLPDGYKYLESWMFEFGSLTSLRYSKDDPTTVIVPSVSDEPMDVRLFRTNQDAVDQAHLVNVLNFIKAYDLLPLQHKER